MRLQKLELNYFKGVANYVFEPNGKSQTIFGDNATYKTTLFDALCWLLFDKDSKGRSPNSFSIKTQENGEVLHHLDHTVEGVFDNIVLKKIYREKWVTKRGSSIEEHDGHETKYFVDEEPVQAGEYKDRIEEITTEEMFQILTNPMYFPDELHWTDRRKVLLDICGEITTKDIIERNEDLYEYSSILDGKTQEAREKILDNRRKNLKEELDNIPSRIDQERKGLYDDVGSVQKAEESIKDLKNKKEGIEAKRSEVKSGGSVAELKVKRQELEADKQEKKNKHTEAKEKSLKDIRQKVSDRQDSVDEIESGFREAQRAYHDKESSVEQLKSIKSRVADELEEVQGREPKEDSGEEVCPMCEQPIENDSEHDYQDYLEEFNQQKVNDIKDSKNELSLAYEELEKAQDEMKKAGQKAANISGKMKQRQQALEKAQSELKEAKESQTPFIETDEYESIAAKIKSVDEKIANHQEEKQSQLNKLDDAIKDIQSNISSAESTIHQSKENERTHARIRELSEKQKEVREKLEETEHQLYVIELFVQEESKYITEQVNELFDYVEWRLFEEQINGGIKQICEPLVDGVPFGGGLNTGSQIKAGLDIINTLASHYEKSAPVFVDNSEAVTSLPETDLQLICLYVSPEDKKLRVVDGLPKHTNSAVAV